MGCVVVQTILILFSYILFFTFFLDLGACQQDPCPPASCSHDGPEIRFPFRLKGQQAERCGYPGFDLSCSNNNKTVLHLRSSSEIFIRNIDYKSQTLSILDRHHCTGGLFFDLNLSASPFSYHSKYRKSYKTFVNCSTPSDYLSNEISCLSGSGYHVYLVDSDRYTDASLVSCQPIKTLHNIPNPVLEESPSMKWDKPECKRCEARRGECRLKEDGTRSETTCSLGKKGSSGKWMKIGVSISLIVLLVALIIIIKLYPRWKLDRKEIENQRKVEKFLENYKCLTPTRYSYADLKRMTNQFKEKLGQGGYGSVYKGALPTGIDVAVKLLQNYGGDGEDFINEVATIGRIHHINVVRLLGFCADRFRRALIYEFMPNESLAKIFTADAKDALGWEKIQDIAIGIARGIEYLHQGCDRRILHFDIKPHNILLDSNFNPKISDFGLAKSCSKGQSTVSMTAARGTIGYIAPEVFSRNFGNVSYKSDVYSFGMLLLEMVGGLKNIGATVENTSQMSRPEWIYRCLRLGEEGGLRILETEDVDLTQKLAIVAFWCIQWCPRNRPSMKGVIHMLEKSMDSLVIPPNPFTTTTPLDIDMPMFEGTEDPRLSTIPEVAEEANCSIFL